MRCAIGMLLPLAVSLITVSSANATELQIIGKVVQTQGHTSPACRILMVRRNDNGTVVWLRLPNTGSDNSILAVAMSAQLASKDVTVDYNDTAGSGCGTEPAVIWIAMNN